MAAANKRRNYLIRRLSLKETRTAGGGGWDVSGEGHTAGSGGGGGDQPKRGGSLKIKRGINTVNTVNYLIRGLSLKETKTGSSGGGDGSGDGYKAGSGGGGGSQSKRGGSLKVKRGSNPSIGYVLERWKKY